MSGSLRVQRKIPILLAGSLLGLWAAFACIPWLPLESLLVWKTTIAVTEFGQWWALLVALTGTAVLGFAGRGRDCNGFALAYAALVIVFLAPFIRARDVAAQADRELTAWFGADPEIEIPSLLRAWSLPAQVTAPTETEEFAPGLRLDYYRAVGSGPVPWLVVVHGGGWNSGDRTQLPELNGELVRRGISVIAVSYGFSPAHPWPAPREDVRAAIRYVREHAAKWNLDPSRWAILGRSAGGQIAESVAYSAYDPTLKGCISFYAPADLVFAYRYARGDDMLNSPLLLRDYLAGPLESRTPAYEDASPILQVKKGLPPTLLIHGNRDTLVWDAQSRRLAARLREAGVPVVHLELPWATHGFDYTLHGPGGQLSTYAVERFLKGVFSK